MEWYYDGGGEELVPRVQHGSVDVKLSDRLTQWGICSNGSFDSPNKYFVAEMKSSGEIHCSHDKFSDEVEMDLVSYERDQTSGLATLSAQTPNATGFCSMFTEDESYVQNEVGGEDDGNFEHDWNSKNAVDLSDHSTLETQSGKAEMWDFSRPSGQNNKHFSTSHHPLVSEENIYASARAHVENDGIAECGNDKISVEESLLLDFEMVMNQMSEQTRYCFRDAFYRLAKNSESPSSNLTECDNNDTINHWECTTTRDEYSRYNKTKEDLEAETNTIDRRVASLMFSNMNFSLETHQHQA